LQDYNHLMKLLL